MHAAGNFLFEHSSGPEAPANFMQTQASVMRAMLSHSPSFASVGTTINNFSDGRIVAWILTARGMQLTLRADHATIGAQSLPGKDLFYTPCFLKVLMRVALDPRTMAHTRSIKAVLPEAFASNGSPCPSLVPSRSIIWMLLVECSKDLTPVVRRGWSRLQSTGDFAAVSIDSTYKVLMSVQGQPKHGQPRVVEDGGNACEREIHAVATARSLRGCMFLARCFFSESVKPICDTLSSVPGTVQQLRLIQVDRPWDWDTQMTFDIFPLLECIGGSPMHVAFEVSYAFGRSSKPRIVKDIKKVMEKWAATGASDWLASDYYVAAKGPPRALSLDETRLVDNSTLDASAAKLLLKNIVCEVPFSSRKEYVEAIGAVMAAHPEHMQKKIPSADVSIQSALRRCIDPVMIEYYANGARWRHRNGIERRGMDLATVGNEGSHFDLRAWGRNVRSQKRARAECTVRFWEASNIIRWVAKDLFQLPGDANRPQDYLYHVIRSMGEQRSAPETAMPPVHTQSGLRWEQLLPMKRPASQSAFGRDAKRR